MENFDELALKWDADPRRLERAKVIAGQMLDHIPGMNLMEGFEYGCGTGLLSFCLQQELSAIWLGDSSSGMLEVLQKKIAYNNISNMKPLQIDLTAGEKPKQKFDLLYTMMTLHHIPDTKGIINTFYELLRPEGYLCIADLDKEDGSFHGEGFVGHNGFDRTELTDKLEKAGFKVVLNELCYNNIKVNALGEEKIYPTFIIICKKY